MTHGMVVSWDESWGTPGTAASWVLQILFSASHAAWNSAFGFISNSLYLGANCLGFREKRTFAGRWWLTPVILATQEAEIRRTAIWSQVGQIVHMTLAQKNPSQKRAGGMAQYWPWAQDSVLQKKKKKEPLLSNKFPRRALSFLVSCGFLLYSWTWPKFCPND
jgi:hypothetical protein